MKFLRFIIQSYVFKRFVPFTIIFLVILFGINKLFDTLWKSNVTFPLIDINNVYKPPRQYDNYKRLNILLTPDKKLAIEGNKKFRISGKQKAFDYYDTTDIKFPDQTYDVTNTIILEFEYSTAKDSILLVNSKSREPNIFWKQIFLSTVIIESLNKFSEDTEKFRINENTLVEPALLEDNDTLITKALDYFGTNKDKLTLGDCGINSATFRDICIKFNLPCRIIGLQGGNADEAGNYDKIGYPQHAICEVYSSKHNKWYVIDPTYGLRFKTPGADDYLNAIELTNVFFFQREKFIIQDSIISAKRTTVGRDYFKYYENVFFSENHRLTYAGKKFMQIFFNKFNYNAFHYSYLLQNRKNGYYYVGAKLLTLFLITILYFNAVLLVITQRLFKAKKPKE